MKIDFVNRMIFKKMMGMKR